jgi:hypothetical protein
MKIKGADYFLGEIHITFTDEKIVLKRHAVTIIDVLSSFGGLFSIVMKLFSFPGSYINRQKLE